MQERCGAWQVGNDVAGGRVEFRVFFPTGPDPEIDAIRVAADFQQTLGGGNWDFARGLPLIQDALIRPDGRGRALEALVVSRVTTSATPRLPGGRGRPGQPGLWSGAACGHLDSLDLPSHPPDGCHGFPLEVVRLQEQERPDTETSEDLARSVLEGPGMEAPRDEVAGKVEEGKAAAGGRLDELDEVEQAAREAEQEP
jgi:hypothetical protein